MARATPQPAPERIPGHPVGSTENRLYFTDGSFVYAGRYPHQGSFPVHTHSFLEIALVTAGQGVHHVMAGRQGLAVGDLVLLRPGVWHGYDDCVGMDLFNCCFSTGVLRGELAWTRDDPVVGQLLWTGPYAARRKGVLWLHLDPPMLDRCLVHLEALGGLRGLPMREYRADAIGRLSLLLGEVARAFAAATGQQGEQTGPTHPAVIAAMRLLETRLAEAWTLAALAEELHLAPGYLIRLFRASTGQPPMAYLSRLRVETAAELLLETDQPISQIARCTGWPDQNYFARRFKAHFGLPASVYRSRFRHAPPGQFCANSGTPRPTPGRSGRA